MSAPDAYNSSALSAVNDKILSDGQAFPVVTLAGGRTVRTGTVATLLHNIQLYNAAAATVAAVSQSSGGGGGGGGGGSEDFARAERDMADLEAEMRLAAPTLHGVGLFRLFRPQEWTRGGASPGKRKVGELAMEMGY